LAEDGLGRARLQLTGQAEQGWTQLDTGQAGLGLIFPEWQRARLGPYEDRPGWWARLQPAGQDQARLNFSRMAMSQARMRMGQAGPVFSLPERPGPTRHRLGQA